MHQMMQVLREGPLRRKKPLRHMPKWQTKKLKAVLPQCTGV